MARWFRDRSSRRGIPSVSLRRLLPEARFVGCTDLEVSGCSTESRRLEPGEIFVAAHGARDGGHRDITQALERGAAAVVVERPCPEAGPLQVIVPDTRVAHARICQALAGAPSERLPVIAVAGSFGRTPAAHMLRSIFEAAGQRFGQIGTLGWTDGRTTYPAGASEPGAESLAEMLALMADAGCAGAIVEVSTATLEHRALSAVRLDAVLITDLGTERLSDNPDALARARAAHARLVRAVVPGGLTVVRADDPAVEPLGATNLGTRRVAFGLEPSADLTARILRLDAAGTRIRYSGLGQDQEATLHLVGRRNVAHALGAAALGLARGLAGEAVRAGLEAVERIPGYLDPICAGQPFRVWIDRAGEVAEVLEALRMIRPLTKGRLICVLSAPDAEIWPVELVRACEDQADCILVTGSDHVHQDDPVSALGTMSAAFRNPGRVRMEIDRNRAIEAALAMARPGDSVLIAGGRRRPLRYLDNTPVACDDRAVATYFLRHRRPVDGRRTA